MAEITGGPADFLSRVFSEPASLRGAESAWTRDEYIRAICSGGYPEVRGLRSRIARSAWYDGYLTAVINRDISDFAEIGKAQAIPRLLSLVAARAGSPLVVADLARSADLDRATARNYLTYLDTVFLTTEVLHWPTNLTSRLSKTPEVFLTDSGLATHLLGATESDLRRVGHPALGGLVETFVHAELMKLATVSEVPVSIWQFRENDNRKSTSSLRGQATRWSASRSKQRRPREQTRQSTCAGCATASASGSPPAWSFTSASAQAPSATASTPFLSLPSGATLGLERAACVTSLGAGPWKRRVR
jgi:hypothetical protein